ncbi:MAG: AAA family ATPase, partial [Ignavibacteriae bacterium]|nr:AAA family ATPase [Ignavibacteriota bacterium]
ISGIVKLVREKYKNVWRCADSWEWESIKNSNLLSIKYLDPNTNYKEEDISALRGNRSISAWVNSLQAGDLIFIMGKNQYNGIAIAETAYEYDGLKVSFGKNEHPAIKIHFIHFLDKPIDHGIKTHNNPTTFAHIDQYSFGLKNVIGFLNKKFPEVINQLIDKKEQLIKGTESFSKLENYGSLNTILYGPPGTGKTYRLFEIIKSWNLIEESATPDYEAFADEYVWWEIIGLALYEKGPSKVPDLLKHPIINAKLNFNFIKHPSQRLWSTLQIHTVDICKNVSHQNRSNPKIFFKEPDSTWRLDNRAQFEKDYEVYIHDYNKFKTEKQGEHENKKYTFTTCHQSLSYEDFIEGIKPILKEDNVESNLEEGALAYKIKKGIFYRACNKAAQIAGYENLKECLNDTKILRQEKFNKAINENRIHVIFMDEINRCNISAVFGELITLIEDDKRLGGKNEIADTILPYSQSYFGVPANLYIVGTMNTADRSVEALDTALRRRFNFEYMKPLATKLNQEVEGIKLSVLLDQINSRISYILDEDHQIGHSFFWDVKNKNDLKEVFRNKIIPLLKEFFYNDHGKIRMILGDAFVSKSDVKPTFAVEDDGDDYIYEKSIFHILELNASFDIVAALKTLLK